MQRHATVLDQAQHTHATATQMSVHSKRGKPKTKKRREKKKKKQRKQKPLKKQYEQQGKTKDVHKTRAHLHGPKYSKELNKQTF